MGHLICAIAVAAATLGQSGSETLRQKFAREMSDPEARKNFVAERKASGKIEDSKMTTDVPDYLKMERAWQTGSKCGPVSLYFLLRLHGIEISMDRVVEAVPLTEEGASMAALQEAAGRFGLKTRAVKFTPEDIPKLPAPYIVHYNLSGENSSKGNHFDVVLKSFDETRCSFIDTTNCVVKTGDYEALVGRVSGYALLADVSRDWWRPALSWAFLAVLGANVILLARLGIGRLRAPSAGRGVVTA